MLSCKSAAELISNKLDRPLSLRERINLKMHLFICTLCRRYAKQIQFIHNASLNMKSKSTLTLSNKRRQRIKQHITNDKNHTQT